MTDEMRNYFKVIGEIQNEIKKTSSFDQAIKVGVWKILQAFPAEYAILWYKEGELLHPYYWRGSKDFTSCTHKVGRDASDGFMNRRRQSGHWNTKKVWILRLTKTLKALRLHP